MDRSHQRWIALVACVLLTTYVATAQEAERGKRRHRSERPNAAQRERHPHGERVQGEQARPPQRGAAHLELIGLRHADPDAVVDLLLQMRPAFGRHTLVSSDERTGTLVVATETDEATKQIRALVETLDQPTHDELGPTWTCRFVTLRHASAKEVVENLYGLRRQPTTRHSVRFAPDERANTVWVAGPPDAVERTMQMIEHMEETTANAFSRESEACDIRFYQVQRANATNLASTLHQIAAMMDLDARITADSASHMLIICATSDEAAELEKVIEKLDVTPKRTKHPKPPRAPDQDA